MPGGVLAAPGVVNAENRGVVATEEGSYLRLTDSFITQLKAQGPSRTCNESKEEETSLCPAGAATGARLETSSSSSLLLSSLELGDTQVYEP